MSVRAVVSGKINTALRFAASRARCAGGRCDAASIHVTAIGAHLDVPRAYEQRLRTSAVAAAWATSAENEDTAQTTRAIFYRGALTTAHSPSGDSIICTLTPNSRSHRCRIARALESFTSSNKRRSNDLLLSLNHGRTP